MSNSPEAAITRQPRVYAVMSSKGMTHSSSRTFVCAFNPTRGALFFLICEKIWTKYILCAIRRQSECREHNPRALASQAKYQFVLCYPRKPIQNVAYWTEVELKSPEVYSVMLQMLLASRLPFCFLSDRHIQSRPSFKICFSFTWSSLRDWHAFLQEIHTGIGHWQNKYLGSNNSVENAFSFST